MAEKSKGLKAGHERTIDRALFDQWKGHYRNGDISKIADISGKSKPVVHRAVRYGQCTDDTLRDAITQFFIDRKTAEVTQAQTLKNA